MREREREMWKGHDRKKKRVMARKGNFVRLCVSVLLHVHACARALRVQQKKSGQADLERQFVV